MILSPVRLFNRATFTLAIISIFLLSGCLPALRIVSRHELKVEDYNDLSEGKLYDVRERYEDQNERGLLNNIELSVLCEIYIKQVEVQKALNCLDKLETQIVNDRDLRFENSIKGKRALIELTLGDFFAAKRLTQASTDIGSRYINALAEIKLGNPKPALFLANQWSYSYNAQNKFLAASLFVAAEYYSKAVDVLSNKQSPRLSLDYALSGGVDIFGRRFKGVPLRLDLFDEFAFGLLDSFSFAPPANMYVEFLIAKSLFGRGAEEDVKDAKKRLQLLIGHPLITAFRDVYWRALYEHGRIEELDGHKDSAIDDYKKAIEEIERMRASISTEAGRVGFVGDKQEVYQKLINLLLQKSKTSEAFYYIERSRARTLVDMLAGQNEIGGRGIEKIEYTKLLNSNRRAEYRLYSAAFSQILNEKDLSNSLDGLRKAHEDLRTPKGVKHHLTLVKSVENNVLNEIQDKLVEEETLIEYYQSGHDSWVCYIVTLRKYKEILIETPGLSQKIDEFRNAIHQPNTEIYKKPARELYKILIEPVEKYLRRSSTKTNKLTIVPHGYLHYLPFAALMKSNKFLIEYYPIRYLPSANVLLLLQPNRPIDRKGTLIFANPTREDQPPLKSADDEAMSIKYKVEKTNPPLYHQQATRRKFLDDAHKFEVLHIISHGDFVPKLPLQSALLLAPTGKESGDLTVSDLFELSPPLLSRLAVLSACETGLSSIAPGDEIISLQYAFLYAGSDSVVSTLWQISDYATAELMKYFYTRLGWKLSVPISLQKAQSYLIKHKNTKLHHPFYWAAFVFSGIGWEE